MKWISVKDRLPDEDARVLVYARDHDLVTVGYAPAPDSDMVWLMPESRDPYRVGLDSAFDVTHWMPLPEAPKGD